jgi:beta-lactam-binding protein with PASTA domain
MAKNSVLEQLYKGERIKPGTKIRMASVIDLVLGTGIGNDEFSVPDLFGMPFQEARVMMESNGLTLTIVGVDPDVSDTASSYVNRQQPEKFTADLRVNRIRQGQNIDVWLTGQRPVRREPDSLSNN